MGRTSTFQFKKKRNGPRKPSMEHIGPERLEKHKLQTDIHPITFITKLCACMSKYDLRYKCKCEQDGLTTILSI